MQPFMTRPALALVLLSGITVCAQDYPARPVRMVIHIGAGSSMDIIGRVLAQRLTDAWSQQVIVDNRVYDSLWLGQHGHRAFVL